METTSRLIDLGSCYIVTLIPKNTGMTIQAPMSQENYMTSGGLRKRRCFHCHNDDHIRSQCPSLGKDGRQPLAPINDNAMGRSAEHYRRRMVDATQGPAPFSPMRPAPSANRGALIGTSNGCSSSTSNPPTDNILQRAVDSIHGPASTTSAFSAEAPRIDDMEFWENQLLS
ncbi:unnamed protein product [Gordionus sp. m RMFG-2023]